MKVKIKHNNIYSGDENVDFPITVEGELAAISGFAEVGIEELKKHGWIFKPTDKECKGGLLFDFDECEIIEQ